MLAINTLMALMPAVPYADDFEGLIPVYETVPGWQESTVGASQWTTLKQLKLISAE